MYNVIEKKYEFDVYRVRVIIDENTQETAFFQFFNDPSQEQIDETVDRFLQSRVLEPPRDPVQQLSEKLDTLSNQVQNLNLSIDGSRISARQIRLWLVSNNISLSSVDDAIDSIPDEQQKEMIKIEWEYAPYIERNHPMLAPLAQILGLSENDINRAFSEASLL